jgi:hypothetical protein
VSAVAYMSSIVCFRVIPVTAPADDKWMGAVCAEKRAKDDARMCDRPVVCTCHCCTVTLTPSLLVCSCVLQTLLGTKWNCGAQHQNGAWRNHWQMRGATVFSADDCASALSLIVQFRDSAGTETKVDICRPALTTRLLGTALDGLDADASLNDETITSILLIVRIVLTSPLRGSSA